MSSEKTPEKYSDTRVLVIGDFMLDRFLYGQASRISPEAPIPLIDITRDVMQLGGAANAVRNISILGGNTIAAGIVGDDWFGRRLIRLFNDMGINTEGLIESKERPTTVKTRLIAGNQQIIRFDKETRDSIDSDLENKLIRFVEQKIDSVDVFLISDYNKGVITQGLLDRIIAIGRKYNKPVVIYPKISPFFYYRGITLALTTRENACTITGIRQINETSIRNMGYWLLSHLESRNVLIIDGKNEMSLFNAEREMTQISTSGSNFQNMTGVIDTIAGLVALSLPDPTVDMKEILQSVNMYIKQAGSQDSEKNNTPEY